MWATSSSQLAFECLIKYRREQGIEFGLVVGLGLSDRRHLGLQAIEPALLVVIGNEELYILFCCSCGAGFIRNS